MEKLFAAALNGLPTALTVLDAEGRYRLWNQAMVTLLGVTADRVIGRLPNEAFPGPPGEELTALARRILRGEVERSTDVYPWMHGPARWIRVSRGPIVGPQGAVTGVYATVESVTSDVRLG